MLILDEKNKLLKKLERISEDLQQLNRSIREYIAESTDEDSITVYFTESALDYMMEGANKDRFKKFLIGAASPKYEPLTDDQLADIEGLQVTYGAESLGTPVNTIPIKLTTDITISDHAKEQMKIRKVPRSDLQKFIDNSMFMFNQQKGYTRLYVSSDGSVVVSVRDDPNGKIATVYSVADYYADKLGPIVEEVKKWLKPLMARE